MTSNSENVCKGDLSLGSGCKRCARCAQQFEARIAELESVIQQLTSSSAVVAAYAVGELRVERALRRIGPKQMAAYWAVRRDGFALNKQGEWEYEPMPSSRTDEFLDRCRFSDVNDAIAAAVIKHEKEAQ